MVDFLKLVKFYRLMNVNIYLNGVCCGYVINFLFFKVEVFVSFVFLNRRIDEFVKSEYLG